MKPHWVFRWDCFCDGCGLNWSQFSAWKHRPRYLDCPECKEHMVFGRLIT